MRIDLYENLHETCVFAAADEFEASINGMAKAEVMGMVAEVRRSIDGPTNGNGSWFQIHWRICAYLS